MKEIITIVKVKVTNEQYEKYGKQAVDEIESGKFDNDIMSTRNIIISNTTVEVKEIDEGQ